MIPGNPYAWIGLVVAVVVALYFKGYIRLTGREPDQSESRPKTEVAGDDSESLGLRYLEALRRKAEQKARETLLEEISKAATEKMQGPLSAPAGDAKPSASDG